MNTITIFVVLLMVASTIIISLIMQVKVLSESNKELRRYIQCNEFTKQCVDLAMKFTAHRKEDKV
jgi:hypothetical protein